MSKRGGNYPTSLRSVGVDDRLFSQATTIPRLLTLGDETTLEKEVDHCLLHEVTKIELGFRESVREDVHLSPHLLVTRPAYQQSPRKQVGLNLQ